MCRSVLVSPLDAYMVTESRKFMRHSKLKKHIKALAEKSQLRRDLVLAVVSLVLGIALARYWTAPKKAEPAGPLVPHAEAPAAEPAPKTASLPASNPAPTVQKTERPAWQRYAAKLEPAPREPMVAIVLDDMGPNRKGTERALSLPAPITFAFLPYAPHVSDFVRSARARGHEILVHVPMEPVGRADPGPHALRVGETPEALRADLDWNLSQFGEYVGINNHMGSRFTADAGGMRLVMGELKARGLLFLDSRTSAETKAADAAHAAGLPTLSRNVFLDNDEEGAEVKAELGKLERLAREHGYAIAIGHPHMETLDILEKWIPEAQARGVSIVPLTAILPHEDAAVVQASSVR